jgi:hypothetical protein
VNGRYILDASGQPQECEDLFEWALWLETAERHIHDAKVGDSRVSTVFRGLDHSFGMGPPLLFETMVFGGPLDGEQERYTNRELASEGHARMCRRILAAMEDARP